MDMILGQLLRWLEIPGIRKSIELKIKEISIQFKGKIEALERDWATMESKEPRYYNFTFERNGDEWDIDIDIDDDSYELEEILPQGLVQIILMQERIRHKIYFIKEETFNPLKNVSHRYAIRYIYDSWDKVIGHVKIVDVPELNFKKDVYIELLADTLTLDEIRDLEEYPIEKRGKLEVHDKDVSAG
jgi:hypothetical protein